MKNKKKIILIGAGGHSISAADVIELENKLKIYGFIDNKKPVLKKYKIIGTDKDLQKIRKKVNNALITIGQIKNLFLREKIYNKLKRYKFYFPKIVSPLAYVSREASVDDGTIIMHRAIINSKAKIGKNCIINTGAIIEHDVVVGNNCHVSTGAVINGGTIIGNNCFIGSGTVIKQNIKIGRDCLINANKFVDKNQKNNSKIL